MRIKKYIILSSIAILAAYGCDRVHVDEVTFTAPVVEAFTPTSAPVGAEVRVTGKSLNNVTEAYIGSVKVDIMEKVSDTRLSIKVANGVTSGKIKLVNNVGEGLSETDFRCTFAVPSIAASLLQAEAEMGDEVLISGTNLNAVTSVVFTAEGQSKGHQAEIVVASEEEIVVKVPYVEDAIAKITFGYFDGTGEAFTSLSEAPSIKVIRYVPTFNAFTLDRTPVGKSIVLTGSYLNNIDKIMVGDFEAPLFKDAGQITFTVPAGNFEDGETTVPLTAWYFDNNESIVLSDAFVVYVPFVRYWENVRTWAQGRTEANEYVSFFSPETGIAYENAKWKDVLDPVALKHNGDQWVAANTPKPGVVTDEEYYSVLPYFFFSAVSGNVLQINSPANSNSQLKNFYISFAGTPANDYRVPGSNNNLPGTPILAFRYLNPSSSVEAETALVQKVLSGKLDNINEALFPIDVAASTVAGISVASFAGAIKSDKWCDHQTAELKDDAGYKTDAVFLVAYYANNGFEKEQPAKNILRLGILHVTGIDWGVYNNSNFGSTRITFNCYWQKYDYDYSKI
ncbi:MAG: IPT/TIG domain-containing protein [Bacteroidales bacterium]|nr:IPT/TIG domain-containing protein [Bacteroidales bacterium]